MSYFSKLSLLLLGLLAFTACDDEDDGIGILNGDERDELVDTYADRYLNNQAYPAVTTRLDDFDQEDAYDFQEDLVDELEDRGERVIGYKLGFTGDSPRPFGAPSPVYGRLLASQENNSGATIDISETFVDAALGVEVALYISRDAEFETSDFPLSDETLMGLIASVAPLVEMPELGFEEGKMGINYLDLIANNAGAKGFVVGTPVALSDIEDSDDDNDRLAIDDINVTVFKDGEQIATSFSGDALGSQLAALEFLLLELARVGEGVEAGQIIATGSLGGDLGLEAGEYRLTYSGLGEHTFTLTE